MLKSFRYKIVKAEKKDKDPKHTNVQGFIQDLKYDNGELVNGQVEFKIVITKGRNTVRQSFTGDFVDGKYYFNTPQTQHRVNGIATDKVGDISIEIDGATGSRIGN